MKTEINRLLTKLFLLFAIVGIAGIASCAGLTEDKIIDLVDNAKDFTNNTKNKITNSAISKTIKDTINEINIPAPEMVQSPSPKSTIVKPLSNIEEIEKLTFELINQERIKARLQPVIWNDKLHNGARAWSNNMQTEGDLYHDSIGIRTYYFAECIYGASWSSHRTPEQTVNAWMNSSGHRAILMGNYRIGAVGIAKNNGFWATYRCKK